MLGEFCHCSWMRKCGSLFAKHFKRWNFNILLVGLIWKKTFALPQSEQCYESSAGIYSQKSFYIKIRGFEITKLKCQYYASMHLFLIEHRLLIKKKLYSELLFLPQIRIKKNPTFYKVPFLRNIHVGICVLIRFLLHLWVNFQDFDGTSVLGYVRLLSGQSRKMLIV